MSWIKDAESAAREAAIAAQKKTAESVAAQAAVAAEKLAREQKDKAERQAIFDTAIQQILPHVESICGELIQAGFRAKYSFGASLSYFEAKVADLPDQPCLVHESSYFEEESDGDGGSRTVAKFSKLVWGLSLNIDLLSGHRSYAFKRWNHLCFRLTLVPTMTGGIYFFLADRSQYDFHGDITPDYNYGWGLEKNPNPIYFAPNDWLMPPHLNLFVDAIRFTVSDKLKAYYKDEHRIKNAMQNEAARKELIEKESRRRFPFKKRK